MLRQFCVNLASKSFVAPQKTLISRPNSIKPISKPRFLGRKRHNLSSKFDMDEAFVSRTEGYWQYLPPNLAAKTLITCEHASNRFPQQYFQEKGLLDTHWASDLGAEDIAGSLSGELVLPSIFSRVSRLVIDVNRPLTSDTLFRLTADGAVIHMNKDLTPEEKQDRIDRFWKTYRFQISTILLDRPSIKFVLSIHTFTPEYEGEVRTCEVGVLYINSKEKGNYFNDQLLQKGYLSVINEPWPGSICDIINLAESYGKECIVLEIRNDLARDPAFKEKIENDIEEIMQNLKLIN